MICTLLNIVLLWCLGVMLKYLFPRFRRIINYWMLTAINHIIIVKFISYVFRIIFPQYTIALEL